MKIQLINGEFTSAETIDLLTQMIQVKIQFLENKIENSHQEEDIKNKESKIIAMQNKLSDLRKFATSKQVNIRVLGEIEIN